MNLDLVMETVGRVICMKGYSAEELSAMPVQERRARRRALRIAALACLACAAIVIYSLANGG